MHVYIQGYYSTKHTRRRGLPSMYYLVRYGVDTHLMFWLRWTLNSPFINGCNTFIFPVPCEKEGSIINPSLPKPFMTCPRSHRRSVGNSSWELRNPLSISQPCCHPSSALLNTTKLLMATNSRIWLSDELICTMSQSITFVSFRHLDRWAERPACYNNPEKLLALAANTLALT